MDRVVNLVVLFSGEGSNLERLIQRFDGMPCREGRIRVVAVTNRPDAGGIVRAARYGVTSEILDHRRFKSREAFDAALVEKIAAYRPVLVVMAGFMRILTPVFTEKVEAINLHPSLLPLFKGANAIARSFKSGMKVGGVTVHRVVTEVDGGEILAQKCVPIFKDDRLEDFEARIHTLEHTLLPDTVERLLKERGLFEGFDAETSAMNG
ncbi:MAG: phosphoribosylglycinamide formyltransferase [Epsilonproteobacteria bacterium]|nr:phosphoribosylglycinamide formyltransferase [Campylobacterota bacterium]